MLKERLTPCATLLYYWLRNYGDVQKINLANFQVWSEEFSKEAFTSKEIDRAFRRLVRLGLLRVKGEVICVTPMGQDSPVKLQPLPKRLLKIWPLEERLAVGSLAIASAIVVAISGFVLVQRPVESRAVLGSLDALSDITQVDL
ncbi:hypothetical protein [[Limnothrix rosea] IAM M-220]|uniref:hypothetical protein n=1 Tax=[Limnothrix rosea] IAM M-220 TaxID=454133 RepID=UPI001115AB21|nr:hypothetical protein [[Limnothrix rosea] IAM M-220]